MRATWKSSRAKLALNDDGALPPGKVATAVSVTTSLPRLTYWYSAFRLQRGANIHSPPAPAVHPVLVDDDDGPTKHAVFSVHENENPPTGPPLKVPGGLMVA